MTTVNGAGGAGTTAPAAGTSNVKATDLLGQDGAYHIDFENNSAGKAYGPMLAMLGKTGGEAVQKKVEQKITDWIKAHPTADEAAVTAQLRKTLQLDTMQYKLMQDSINKMMRDIEAKMKEIAADRFG